MQTITTLYKAGATGQGRVQVKSQYGTKRVLWDDALNSEQNHRAAVLTALDAINKDRGTRFEIINSAPHHADNGGWIFLINQAPEIAPCYQSITVRFMPGTNTQPPYMKAHSWLFPKGVKVEYSPRECQPGDIQGAAFYAARVMLDMINDGVKSAGISYRLGEYLNTYTGDRVFSLR